LVNSLANEGVGRLFRRPDGKYLVYVPVSEAEDSMFPFKDLKPLKAKSTSLSCKVKVRFEIGKKRLVIEPVESEGA